MKIYTTPTALERANTINGIVFWNQPGGTKIDYTSWKTLASDNAKLLDALSTAMMPVPCPTNFANRSPPHSTRGSTDLTVAPNSNLLDSNSQWYSVQH